MALHGCANRHSCARNPKNRTTDTDAIAWQVFDHAAKILFNDRGRWQRRPQQGGAQHGHARRGEMV
nr:MAG TPA: hypothetical protein [Caudoviricetes sp.]